MNNIVKYFAKNNLITKQIENYISESDQLDKQTILTNYNKIFIKTFRKAYRDSNFYNNLYRKYDIKLNDINDISDLYKLPIINRDSIKNEENNIYAGLRFLKLKALTSGTSGSPLTVYRSPISINYESAYVRYFRLLHGFKNGEPLVSIRGKLDKNKLFEYSKISNTLYLSSPNINSKNIDQYYRLIKELKPKAIEAFPSYLFKLYNELSKKDLSINIPLAFTSSEMLYEFQREKIEPYFKTKIYDWYGNVERTIGLVQNKEKKYTPLPFYSINEFENEKVITTSLNNIHFPLIRYQVDDVIKVNKNDFISNIISPEIISIKGRIGETIDLKDGGKVGCIDHAFKGINHLEQAQIYQKCIEEVLIIKLVVHEAFNKIEENKLRSNLINMLGDEIDIEFIYCALNELIFFKNEKFRLIIKGENY